MKHVTNCKVDEITTYWKAARQASVNLILTTTTDIHKRDLPLNYVGIHVPSEDDWRRFWDAFCSQNPGIMRWD